MPSVKLIRGLVWVLGAFVTFALCIAILGGERSDGTATDMSMASRWVAVYVVVDLFLGLSGLLNVAFRPAADFERAGRSKAGWLGRFAAATLVGLAPPLWLAWLFGVRPRLDAGVMRARGGGAGWRPPTAPGPTTPYQSPLDLDGPRPCGTCGGRGHVRCLMCGGSRVDVNGNPCFTCRATGDSTCTGCGGSGHR